MTYIPRQITAEDKDVKRDVEREHRNISTEFATLVARLPFDVTSNEPLRPELGTFVYADGVNWSPDVSGNAGFYIYGTTGWLLLAADI